MIARRRASGGLSALLFVSWVSASGCTGKDPVETGTPTEVTETDTGPPPNCDELHWRSGSMTISTQTGIDSFCPESNALDGDLVIHLGNSDDTIVELDGISCLCEVSGSFEILHLPTVEGLRHVSADLEVEIVERIGGDLYVHHIPGLTTLHGFSALQSVGGNLVLESNPLLLGVEALSLERVGGTMRFVDNAALEYLIFPTLSQAGSFEVGPAGEATWHEGLAEVSLESLEGLGGSFRFRGVPALTALAAPALTEIAGALEIEASCGTSLGFDALQSVGTLSLKGLCGISDLSGLGALTTLTDPEASPGLEITHNDLLDQAMLEAFAKGLEQAGGKAVLASGEKAGCEAYWSEHWLRPTSKSCL